MEESSFIQSYETPEQLKIYLADTQNIFCELGRGSGKSTEVFASRHVRVCAGLPGANILLTGPTYVSLLANIIPAITEYWSRYYVEGLHFVVGQEPPSFFRMPKRKVIDYKRCISTVWGTTSRLASADRSESVIGTDSAHVFLDEMLKLSEENVTQRIFPTLRGNRLDFGKSHYFGGISGFSSSPNINTNDEDWWCRFEKDMNIDAVRDIQSVALEVSHIRHKLLNTKSEQNKKRYISFINNCENWLSSQRIGKTYYAKASSFSNLIMLGPDYIDRMAKGIKNKEMFKSSVLNIRPKRVENMFWAKFSKKHIFLDGYIYDRIDKIIDQDGLVAIPARNCSDLRYCNLKQPLWVGYDPGGFSSIVIGQDKERTNEFMLIKNMYVHNPDGHIELAKKFAEFFSPMHNRDIFLYPDRAAFQQHKAKYTNEDERDSDAKLLVNALKSYGFNVQIMNPGQPTIYHAEHYNLGMILFGEQSDKTVRIRVCNQECEELISSLYFSPLKKTQGKIELDKSSEKNVDITEQMWYSTQLPSAMSYLLYGKYSHYLTGQDKYDTSFGIGFVNS